MKRLTIRLELVLMVVFSAVWLLAVLGLFRILPFAGAFELDLYRLYSVAAVLGWVSGNVYVARRRVLPGGKRWKRSLLLAYVLGPPGVVYLLRSFAPTAVQNAAPFVPIYAFLVYAIFFLVPVTLRVSPATSRRR